MTDALEFHPLANQYPLLEGEPFEQLVESLREGFLIEYPIIIYEGRILDGRNRYRACREAGVPYLTQDFFGTEEEAAEFVRKANEARRHLTVEFLHQRRLERLERVAEARAEGKSIRQIAEQEHVSPTRIFQDVQRIEESPTVSEGADDDENAFEDAFEETVAEDPLEVKKRVEESQGHRGYAPPKEEREPEPVLDGLDKPVPPGLVPVFEKTGEFKEIISQINALSRRLEELAQHPAGASLRLAEAKKDLKNVKEHVRFDTPYCVCPMCEGNAKKRKDSCPCKQRGWLVQKQYDALPKD